MKTIGLLGHTSWPSTLDYLKIINEMSVKRQGGFHSAELILRGIDYHDIKSRYGARWSEVPPLLKERLEQLIALRPDCIVICNNTLHKALDEISGDVQFNNIPVIHIVEETGKEAQRRGYKKVLLLGTQFTMEDGYYAGKLSRDFGLSVDIPGDADRAAIQKMQTRIANGEDTTPFVPDFADMLERYTGYDAIVLACTELPLVVSDDIVSTPILNPTLAQCAAAVNFALD